MNNILFLAASIILTSWLTLSFKVIERFGVNTLQAIVYNYITCVVTGSVFLGSYPVFSATGESWFPWALVMGLLFITLFSLVGYVSKYIGVGVAAVAFKLSLVIPFLFSVFYFDENITILKTAGVLVAIPAVVLTLIPAKNKTAATNKPVPVLLWLMPLLLFLGSGILDAMIKYVEQGYLNGQNQDVYLVTAFSSASAAGIIILLVLMSKGRTQFSWKAVVAGIAIGVPNYFSIWCLMKALKGYAGNSSAVIPINNMGIVLCSAVVAWWLLNEKLSFNNRLGIGLSVVAIGLIAVG